MEELKLKIEKELDFLSDHWTMDDQKPFSYGGWKGEVLDAMMEAIQSHIREDKQELLSWIKKESLKSARAGVLGYDFVHRIEAKLERAGLEDTK